MTIFAPVRAAAAAALLCAALPAGAAADGTASPAPAPAATVNTVQFAYTPDTVTVKPGDTVLFKNSDATAHTVTAADQSFDSGNMAQGATWSHVFATAGTYKYFCSYHSYMRATVIVKAP